ncbi:MAG: hypothetical protein HRU69_14650 [Flammeovirgaceae bacterium]|nr:MAG: hypothetical protein HRU69_14650 [Flammeovirgaceae bacterium]
MARFFVVVVALSMLLGSCTQKMVCPAYQSAYIYDKNELRKKFSYFNEDSTPKILTASKNKYLVAEPISYKKKLNQIKTVPAKPVKPVVPDSLTMDAEISKDDLEKAARSVIDSTFIVDTQAADSVSAEPEVYVISKDREVRVLKYNFPDSLKYDPVAGKYIPEKPNYYIKNIGFNTEQDNYMWYLREVLVLPDVRLAQEQVAETQKAAGKTTKEKKGIAGFFSNLFGKKKKKAATEEVQPAKAVSEEDQYNLDFTDLDNPRPDSVQQADVNTTAPVKKKKGLFSKKEKPPKAKTEQKPPAKKEEEGDGF